MQQQDLLKLLQLSNISLFQYKNYPQAAFTFTKSIVGICGSNGVGKTNLLDAIYYLCFTRSYFSKADAQHVLNGAQGFRIAGNFSITDEKRGRGNAETICIFRETGKKEFFLNGEQYEKFSQHIGKFPCVFIAPDDVQIITGTSEERRHYLDALICQADAAYLQHLMGYNKVLQQRNTYLKTLQERKEADYHLLDAYDQQLAIHGNYLFTQRKIFLQRIIPLVNNAYKNIAGSDEEITLSYESLLLNNSFDKLLQQSREKDCLLQRTTRGIHRDDVDIKLKEQPFKFIASQGQRKSLLFALKLAEFEILQETKGFPPVLLLDDVFEKLDDQRMYNLLNRVCVQNKGQVFITDTHRARLELALAELHQPYQLIQL